MLPVEKEMIEILMNGASTPLENVQVSFFLVVWSSLLLAVLRMVGDEKETKGFIQASGFRELAEDFAKKVERNAPAQGGRRTKGRKG